MTSKPEICVLVLATEKNKAIQNELVSVLTTNDVCVCLLGSRIGANIWKDLDLCLQTASKVVTVCTDDLEHDMELCNKISIVLVKFNHYNVINLVPNL